MAKEEIDIEKLPSLNVGVFGHIDHGKTTLLQKLTGKWTDTHSEELKRGITIKLGYADTLIYEKNGEYGRKEGKPVKYVTFVDAPGHEMLMAIMLSGAAIIDAAILVIAASEGIQPQTREHLTALQAKNISKIIVIQNKIDLVSKEEAKKNHDEIKKFLKGSAAEKSEIIPVSAQQEINIDKVFEKLAEIEVEEKSKDEEPIFLVARSFDINKPGTEVKKMQGGVLGGTLKQGEIKVGEEIEIKPGRNYKKENQIVYEAVKTKVMGLRKGNYDIKKATPGGSVAIQTELDPNLTKADSLSGCIAGKNIPEPQNSIKMKYKLFDEVVGMQGHKNVEDIKSMENLMLSVNTSTTVGTVKIAKNNEAEIKLRIPVVPLKGESVGIARNINSHWRLIGFGEIID